MKVKATPNLAIIAKDAPKISIQPSLIDGNFKDFRVTSILFAVEFKANFKGASLVFPFLPKVKNEG